MFEPDEGFSLRDLAAFARAVRTYDSFGKSIETVGRLAGMPQSGGVVPLVGCGFQKTIEAAMCHERSARREFWRIQQPEDERG